MDTQEPKTDRYSANDERIVKPGEYFYLKVRFDEDLPESEATHVDILFEDFLNNPKAFDVEVTNRAE